MSAPARVTLQLCGALTGEVFNGGALDSRVQPMETETGDVVELPDYPLSHRVVGRARMVSDIGSAPGKPPQHPHRQRITESPIQVIPVIQQRPLFSLCGKNREGPGDSTGNEKSATGNESASRQCWADHHTHSLM